MDYSQKQRKDKGASVFDSEVRRNATFTVEHALRKLTLCQNRGENLSTKALTAATKAASPAMVEQAKEMAASFQQQAPFLVAEVQKSLQHTNDSITWEETASQLSGGGIQIVCANTMCSFVMNLPDSSYQTTRVLPHLSQHHKENRHKWSIEFWLFWNIAKTFHLAVQIVLVHMDEKWFFAIVVQKHNKCIPFLAVQTVSHSVHHKSHIKKTMAIATTVYIPHDNDMTRGGRAMKVSLERVGGCVKADRTSHKRECKADGTYHYPPRPDNISKEEGKEHWTPMEITGATEGTKKTPKFSLLKNFLEKEIPRLEHICRLVFSLTGKLIIIRCQMDGAGPHRCQILLERLNLEFERRGWILKFQPSQSPLTNVKDTCVFPAMSNEVTAEQGLSHGSHVLETEQLWKIVTQCWDQFSLETIARAYAGHHQIVNAIAAAEQGGDQFSRAKGLHCNIRKHCIPYFESETATRPSGVEMLESMERANVAPLKCQQPDIEATDFSYADLNAQELACLAKHLPTDHEDWLEINNASALAELDGE